MKPFKGLGTCLVMTGCLIASTNSFATVQFHNQFYLYALIFVLFDVEAVFFFPWAVTFRQLGLYALAEMAVFVGLLLVGYAYAWRKKALEWK